MNAKLVSKRRISEDLSNFEAGKSSNGGKYGFWEEELILELENGKQVKFTRERTTADFGFCEVCGEWTQTTAVYPITPDGIEVENPQAITYVCKFCQMVDTEYMESESVTE